MSLLAIYFLQNTASWQANVVELSAVLSHDVHCDGFSADWRPGADQMGLGDKAAALALAERAMAVNPIEKDASTGVWPIDFLARVTARIGEPDRAIGALQKLLSIPGLGALAENVPLTPALLRLDPIFDPLRNDPRFQKLVASFAPKDTSK
jgi:hypothetical protein